MRLLIIILSIVIPTMSNAQVDFLIFEEGPFSKYDINDSIDSFPEFPRGKDLLKSYIERMNNWQAGQDTIEGTVFVGFVVEPDGRITEIELLKSIHSSCDSIALDIVRRMPDWKPAEVANRPVRSTTVLPIYFGGLK